MVNCRFTWMSQVAACVTVVLAIIGCAEQRISHTALAVSYESPRPWGFGWSVVLLQDGLALIQFNAEPAECIRVQQKEVDLIFSQACRIVHRKDAMVNVVESQIGTIGVHADAGVEEAVWDEMIKPNYGFTVRSMQPQYEGARDFVSDWMRLKADLAGAISAAPRIEMPQHINPLSDGILRATTSRWESSRPWWQELMERSYRARQVPFDQP